MNIVDFSLNRPTTIMMIFLAILLLGIIALINLPIELMPTVNLGRITITTYIRGGLSSEDIEERITRVLEEALGDTSYLKNILTISKDGESTVVLEFEPEANMDYVSLEVREKLAKVREKMPREAERPIVLQYGYGEFPITAVTFVSEEFSPEELRKLLEERLKERFLRIAGVARIETVGGREEKIIIEVDEKRTLAHHLSLRQILDTLAASNINIAGGKLDINDKDFVVRCIGEFPDVEAINNLPVQLTSEGSQVRMKDIGKVSLNYLESRELGRINLHPSVSFYIFKKSLANTLKVCAQVVDEAKDIEQALSPHIKILVPFNQGEFIEEAIVQLRTSLLIGATLAVLVLLLFLKNTSSILILSLSLPFSIFLTFSFMYLLKLSVNVMTLAGLCLGGGMLLDSSIVVLENIFRRQGEGGKINKEQIALSTKEVSLAIFASTLTTLIVFLPFLFLNKETQKLYSGISLTITFSLVASLFISISLVPLVSHSLLRKATGIKRVFFTRFQTGYKKSLGFILHLRYLVVGIVLLGITVVLFLGTKLEKEFIGVPQVDKFTTFIQMPTGTRLEITDKIVRRVEGFLEEYHLKKEVKNYTTHVEPFSAKIYVQLTPFGRRKRTATEIISELREKTKQLDPAFVYYEEPQEIESKEIILEFLGYDYTILKNLAKEAGTYVPKVEGLTDVKLRMREGGPRFNIVLNKEKLALWNLNTEQISTELHGKLRGLIPTKLHIREAFLTSQPQKEQFQELSLSLYSKYAKELEIIARLHESYRKKFKDIENVGLVVSDGFCRLSQIAHFETDLAPSEIWRKNKKRMVQLSANREGVPLSKAAREIETSLKDLKFPEGYLWRFGEGYYKMLRNQRELKLALFFALFLVYLVLASLFESFSQPFIILAAIPLAGIGSISFLYFKKEPVGIGVLIGAIMLSGIVVNNAIILVDYINRLRKKGFSTKSAILESCSLRLRPILMTTLTTILPLFPLLIFKTDASPLWAPLALTVVSGLIVSSILTLYVIPCLYLFLYSKR